ncbi:ATP-dependent DNA helicase, partial [Metschnikowia bicuspidata var. bicuspidata NRRL YB-4993]
DTDVLALQAYILACEDKINLLIKCNAVSDSTSLSLDAKKLWHAEKFIPKMRALDEQVGSLRRGFSFLKPVPTDLSNIHSDASFANMPPLSIVSSPVKATLQSVFHVLHTEPTFTEGSISLTAAETRAQDNHPLVLLDNDNDTNTNEARHEIFNRRTKSPLPPPLHEDIDEDDPEDVLGENYMDGLQSSQVDDIDTDLSGFIAHGDDDEDEEFADRTFTYTQASQTQRHVIETDDDENSLALVHEEYSIRNEVDEIKLSQDVAQRYSISYDVDTKAVEISDEESENDDGNFTTQLLNEGRDQVVEVFSDDDFNDGDFAALESRTHVKNECSAVDAHIVDESDFSDDDDEILKIAAVDGVEGPDKELLAGSESFIDEVYSVLRNTFQLSSFRPNQLKAVIFTLKGKDVFVLIPTGGGKSLCYQLPALVTRGKTRGTTVVISPLISLMQDQIHHLQKRNIRADMISSRGSVKEKNDALRSFAAGDLDLVYLSPEMVNKAQSIQRILAKLYENNMLARIVVDEAHCVSSWGHDFRPDYQGMSMFKENFPKVPIMALTATANEKVRLDIINNLRMNDAVLLKQSFNRTNLFYKVMKKPSNVFEWLRDYISGQQFGNTGIIYCHSKQSCETTSEKLESYGIKCKFYHAGMDADERFSVQTDWQENRIQVICATIAFGMGIDKPDVRFVIHIYIPRTLEGYYQETGRAGRDGNPSECIMFYAYKDARSLKGLIEKDKDLDWSSREMHLAKLRQVIQYCENGTDCRRRQVLHYFNEIFDAKLCNRNCDNCCSEIVSVKRDVTDHCANIVKLVQSIHMDKVTVIHCQDVYWGSKNQKIMTLGHYNNPHHGSGRDLNKGDMERIFFYLQCENALMEYQVVKGGYATSYVKLGPQANTFMKANKKVELSFAQAERPSSTGGVKLTASGKGSGMSSFRYQESFRSAPPSRIVLPQDTFDGAITDSNKDLIDKAYFELRNSRTLKVSELGYARAEAFIGDNLLKEMAIKLPTNARDFARLSNVTKEQADHFKHFKQVLTNLSRERK